MVLTQAACRAHRSCNSGGRISFEAPPICKPVEARLEVFR